ncbi:MAG TPA: hypothetical protein VG916_08450 [Gemmatimonadaceae bacterium]|nr:hypothetical protein [Gemmatimonadaceae bacterium]
MTYIQGTPAPATAPVVAPVPSGVPAPQAQPGVAGAPAGSPAQVYRALRAQRNVLGDQMDEVQSLRRDIVNQMQEQNLPAAVRASLEKRLASTDERVANLDKQIAASDQAVAQAAAVPGATVQPPAVPRTNPDPDMVAGLTFTFLLVIAIPITIAYARRIWRRSARTEVRLPPEMVERMEGLERGVEAIALEVERIGEGQRFLTQAMVERGEVRAVGPGERVPVRARGEGTGTT